MKTIGMIGGFSWHSSQLYYEKINRYIHNQLGGNHSAKIILHSIDFEESRKLQQNGKWELLAGMLLDIARKQENSGADCLLLCSNTMHRIARELEHHLKIPLIHIIDALARQINKDHLTCVALLGTKESMCSGFYKALLDKYGIELIIPDETDLIDDKIFTELVFGKFRPETREIFLEIIEEQYKKGAEAIIYGCTEIPILMNNVHIPVKTYDSLDIHVRAAVEFALG